MAISIDTDGLDRSRKRIIAAALLAIEAVWWLYAAAAVFGGLYAASPSFWGDLIPPMSLWGAALCAGASLALLLSRQQPAHWIAVGHTAFAAVAAVGLAALTRAAVRDGALPERLFANGGPPAPMPPVHAYLIAATVLAANIVITILLIQRPAASRLEVPAVARPGGARRRAVVVLLLAIHALGWFPALALILWGTTVAHGSIHKWGAPFVLARSDSTIVLFVLVASAFACVVAASTYVRPPTRPIRIACIGVAVSAAAIAVTQALVLRADNSDLAPEFVTVCMAPLLVSNALAVVLLARSAIEAPCDADLGIAR